MADPLDLTSYVTRVRAALRPCSHCRLAVPEVIAVLRPELEELADLRAAFAFLSEHSPRLVQDALAVVAIVNENQVSAWTGPVRDDQLP